MGGASGNQFGSVLGRVHLNEINVDWSLVNVDSVMDAPTYDAQYQRLAQSARSSSSIQDALQQVKDVNVKMEYSSLKEFARLAKQLHLMTDEKAGVPRTAYKGIVETRPHGDKILFLVPRNV